MAVLHDEQTFFGPYINYWIRYADFDGKTTRRGYWMVFLVNLLLSFALGFFFYIDSNILDYIDYIYGLITLIPGLAISVRRLHDIGKSGWYLLLSFVPIIGWILLIYWYCQPSLENESKENISNTN